MAGSLVVRFLYLLEFVTQARTNSQPQQLGIT